MFQNIVEYSKYHHGHLKPAKYRKNFDGTKFYFGSKNINTGQFLRQLSGCYINPKKISTNQLLDEKSLNCIPLKGF